MVKRRAVIFLLSMLALTCAAQAQWTSMGPFGGNARALAYDPSSPDHILLGSGGGALFESRDGGTHWQPFAQLGPGHELMLETIAFDPSHPETIYVGGWSITGSGDSRRRAELERARSAARQEHPGAGDCCFRSAGAGGGSTRWTSPQPEWRRELGTHHSSQSSRSEKLRVGRDRSARSEDHLRRDLDGGQHWSNIKQGVIDDSDVFSIILDPGNPQRVFASACSGIYRSDDGGQLFRKVQGIPSTARRTRVLQQDPADADTVYAGTTEGLWKSTDWGKAFKRISPADFILNDILVDPRNSRRLLIATDRGGVFASDDGGQTFHPSNDGFSHRRITAVVSDPKEPSGLYVSVANDKQFGGVFHRREGRWTQLIDGLGTREIFDLERSPEGQLVAATNYGLYQLQGQKWEPSRTLLIESKSSSAKPASTQPASTKAAMTRMARKSGPAGKSAVSGQSVKNFTRSTFEGRATALALSSRKWYAATSAGVLVSDNHGATWLGGAVEGEREFYSVSARDHSVAATTLRSVWLSSDEGEHWSAQPLPTWVTRIYSVAVVSEDELWAATREGALHWRRKAAGRGEWERVLNGLPEHEVISIRAEGGLLLAGAAGSDKVYLSRNQGQSWVPEAGAGVEVTGAVMHGDRLYLISRQHGMLERLSAAPQLSGGAPVSGVRAKLASN